MPACVRCEIEKPSDGFYNTDRTCKECRKAMVRANRSAKIEHYREYDRARANRPDRVAARAAYQQTERGKERLNAGKAAYTKRDPVRAAANRAVCNAIRDGKLQRPACCMAPGCFETRDVQAHHHHYDNPLDVNWLCEGCHKAVHNQHREYSRRRAGSAAQQREGALP